MSPSFPVNAAPRWLRPNGAARRQRPRDCKPLHFPSRVRRGEAQADGHVGENWHPYIAVAVGISDKTPLSTPSSPPPSPPSSAREIIK